MTSQTTDHSASRRHFLSALGLTSAALATGALSGRALGQPATTPAQPQPKDDSPPSQAADAPAQAASASLPAGVYPINIGGIEAMVIHDGALSFKPMHPTWGNNRSKEELDAILRPFNVNPDDTEMEAMPLVVKDGSDLTIIDPGCGTNMGPSAGKLLASLAAIGISRHDVKRIVLTHAHLDHIGGCIRPDGSAAFPNATLVLSKPEFDFWSAETPDFSKCLMSDDFKKGVTGAAKAGIAIFGKKVETVAADGRISDNLSFRPLHGHTPGQCGVVVGKGPDSVLVTGDCIAHHILSFAAPTVGVVFDTVPEQAIEARVALLKDLASTNQRILSYHLNWPGLGRVRKGDGVTEQYRFLLEPYRWAR